MGNHILLACGIAAGPVFTLAYLLEGARRKDYKPLRHPVSSLALGPAFLMAGLLSLAFAVGGAGAFRTDPVSGYPAGTPDRIHDHTRAGALHDGVSLGSFFSPGPAA